MRICTWDLDHKLKSPRFAVLLWTITACRSIAPVDGYRFTSLPALPCREKSSLQYDFCRVDLPVEHRVQDLISLLSPEEKVSLLGNHASAVPGVLPRYEWWGEALHGVANYAGNHKVKSTSFPQVCSLGVSFNRTLFAAIGEAIGDEAEHHFFEVGDMPSLTFWTPNVNLFRDPRWGRGQETPGEDPYLNGEYASSLIPNLQYGKGDRQAGKNATAGRSPRVAAACKHFYAYSLETGRLSFDARIQERDAIDSYLPMFKKCVEAGVLGFMCSYNAVNGVPSCANKDLLTGLLRDTWHFDGYITGDCNAVQNIFKYHNFSKTPEMAVAMALDAGVDTDCGQWIQTYGREALDEGILSIETVDRALKNLLQTQFRLGYFDLQRYTKRRAAFAKADSQDVAYHNDLALEAAKQAIVLLKNNGTMLPLAVDLHKKIAMFGPNGDAPRTMQGNYEGIAPFLISPVEGLDDYNHDVKVAFHRSCNISSAKLDWDTSMCDVAKDSDATILVVGLDQSIESEARDRTSLELPGRQHDLIRHASTCAKGSRNNPVILIVMAGGPVDLSPYKNDPQIDSIMYVGYPGQAGGRAIAEMLYGEVNPSGRLTTTIYPADFAAKATIENMNMRPNEEVDFPGRTYRFYNQGDEVYPFGFGLSYSTFSTRIVLDCSTRTNLVVEVYNRGPLDGSHSILVFHAGPNSGIEENPIKSLVGFDKVYLHAGDSVNVTFSSIDTDVWREVGPHAFFLGLQTNELLDFKFVVSVREDDFRKRGIFASLVCAFIAFVIVRFMARQSRKAPKARYAVILPAEK